MSLTKNERAPLHTVTLAHAHDLSPLFDEAVRNEQPVIIVRGGQERGLLVSQEALLRMLAAYQLHVDVLSEDDSGFTLWLRELDLGGHGQTLREARQALLAAIRSYARDYFAQFGFFRHLPDKARQEPYVVRLSLAKNDAELLEMLFGSEARSDAAPLLGAPLAG